MSTPQHILPLLCQNAFWYNRTLDGEDDTEPESGVNTLQEPINSMSTPQHHLDFSQEIQALSQEWQVAWHCFFGICIGEFEGSPELPFLEWDRRGITPATQERIDKTITFILSNQAIFQTACESLHTPTLDNKCVELFLLLKLKIEKIAAVEKDWSELRSLRLLVYFTSHISTVILENKILDFCNRDPDLCDSTTLLTRIPANSTEDFMFCKTAVFHPLELGLRSRGRDEECWGLVLKAATQFSPKKSLKMSVLPITERSCKLVCELLDLHELAGRYEVESQTGTFHFFGADVFYGDHSWNSLKAFLSSHKSTKQTVESFLRNYLWPLITNSLEAFGITLRAKSTFPYEQYHLDKHDDNNLAHWIQIRLQLLFGELLKIESLDDIVDLYEKLSEITTTPHALQQIAQDIFKVENRYRIISSARAFQDHSLEVEVHKSRIPQNILEHPDFITDDTEQQEIQHCILIHSILCQLQRELFLPTRLAATLQLFCMHPVKVFAKNQKIILEISALDRADDSAQILRKIQEITAHSPADVTQHELSEEQTDELESIIFITLHIISQKISSDQRYDRTVDPHQFMNLIQFCKRPSRHLISDAQRKIFNQFFERAMSSHSYAWIFATAFAHPHLPSLLSPLECYEHRAIIQEAQQHYKTLGKSSLHQIYRRLLDYKLTQAGVPFALSLKPRLFATIASHLKRNQLDCSPVTPPSDKFSELSELVKRSISQHGCCWDDLSGNILFLPNRQSPIASIFEPAGFELEGYTVGPVAVIPRQNMTLLLCLAQQFNTRFPQEAIDHPFLNTLLMSHFSQDKLMLLSSWCQRLGPCTRLLEAAIQSKNILLAYLLVYWGTPTPLPAQQKARPLATLLRIPPEHPYTRTMPDEESLPEQNKPFNHSGGF